MNTMTRRITNETLYERVQELRERLNQATNDLGHEPNNDVGVARIMYVMEALAIFLRLGSGTKDMVHTNAEEPQVVPFPMEPCPGQVFPCPFLVSHLPRTGYLGSVVSTLSAVAAYNMGVACHRQSFVCSNYSECAQLQLCARQFYKTAYHLLDRLCYISPHGSLIQVYLALCTNLAEMEFEDGNVDASRAWRGALTNTMAYVPDGPSDASQHFRDTCVFYAFETPAAKPA